MDDKIVSLIEQSYKTKNAVISLAPTIQKVASTIIESYKNGGKLITMGNGGSAADAQHIVAELIGKYEQFTNPLPAIALTTNSSVLTAIGNDFEYAEVFSRQITAIAKKNDAVLAISTSGNSSNVINGINAAKKIGCRTIGLTGGNGGKLYDVCETSIVVPNNNTQIIQECHITIYHILCRLVKESMNEP